MSVEQLQRQFLFELWKKAQNNQALSSAEKSIFKIIEMHPEIHSVLSNPEVFSDHEFKVDEPDPFVHIELHAIVLDMINQDAPAGIRSIYDRRVNQTGDKHETQHDLMLAVFEWLAVDSFNKTAQKDEEKFLSDLRAQFKFSEMNE